MAGARHTADSARADVRDALADGRRRRDVDRARPAAGAQAFLALQRKAGNAAPNGIAQGSFTVLIGGFPAARVGDLSMPGSPIGPGPGCPTVIIGG